MVTVVTSDGKRKALCASPQQDLMRSFMTDLAARTGVKGEDAASTASDLKRIAPQGSARELALRGRGLSVHGQAAVGY